MNRKIAILISSAALFLTSVSPCAVAGLQASSESPKKQLLGDAEFTKLLGRSSWSWSHNPPFTPHPVVFLANGEAKQSHGWTAKWAITGEREVTVTFDGKSAVLHFNRSVTKFRGIDFNGRREIWGELELGGIEHA